MAEILNTRRWGRPWWMALVIVFAAMIGNGVVLAHPFDKVVPQIQVIADLHKGLVRVEYIFEYRTLDASLEEQTKREIGLDANGDGVITEEERRTRVRAYCDDVVSQAMLLIDGKAVELACDYDSSAVYRLKSDEEIEAVGNYLVGYVLVLKTAVLPRELAVGKREIAFHNAEKRIQRTKLLADSMRGIVWWKDARLGPLVSDAFDRTFKVIDRQFDQIIFTIDVEEAPWHSVAVTEPIKPVESPGDAARELPPVDEAAKTEASAADRAREAYDPTPRTQSEVDQGRIEALITEVKGGGMATILALLAFFLWGAWHAIQPGHGKTLVASYLIGTHGRPRDALVLGITVTLAHVSGVFVFLGLYVFVEWLDPELVSRSAVQDGMVILFGLIIFIMGIGLVMKAVGGAGHHHDIFGRHTDGSDHDHSHDHEHGHSHSHGDGHTHSHGTDPAKLTTWQIIRLGILGGMLPCPAAVTLALWMLTQGEPVLGMVLLTVFSVGLAAVLSAIGLIMVATRSYMNTRARSEHPMLAKIAKRLPLIGGSMITLIGLTMVLAALHSMGWVDLRILFG